ncbi:MAG: tetratricopeptide repeat protein [Bacteroidetes bacterium]|nr:tetratricopeptide repeat protein [Bacteroidota bacterium]
MARRISLLLAAATLLVSMTGCGTRSILVPVTRYADIDLRGVDTLLVLPSVAANPTFFTRLIAERLDSLLPARLAEYVPHVVAVNRLPGAPSIFASGGNVSRRSLRWWKERGVVGLLLHVAIADGRLSEQVAAAEIQSTRSPGSVKYVRQGRAEALSRIVFVDARRERLLFDDTLRVQARDEQHATDSDPPPLEEHLFAEALARDIAGRIADATHPVQDSDVVTFLVDDAYPEINTAIVHAEAGRWKQAVVVLRRLAETRGEEKDADIIWYDLGLVLQYNENFKDALAAFDRAIALRNKGRYRQARAELLQRESEYLDRIESDRR